MTTQKAVGGVNGHSINCQCVQCTGGDPHLMRMKGEAGKNASFNGRTIPRFNARPGTYGTRGTTQMPVNNYNGYAHRQPTLFIPRSNYADVVPIALNKPNAAVAPAQFNLGGFLMGLGTEALGTIIEMKKAGTKLPPALDKVAGAGIQTIEKAQAQAQVKGNEIVGANVLKFSPFILGGIALLVVLVIYFVSNRK